MIRANIFDVPSFPLKPSYAEGTGKFQAEYEFLLRQSPKLEQLPYGDNAKEYCEIDLEKGTVKETRKMARLVECLREISRLEFYTVYMRKKRSYDEELIRKIDSAIPGLVMEVNALLSM